MTKYLFFFFLAKPMSANLNFDAEFAYGAGQINPIRAPYSGLVYDATETDYIKFLCAHGHTTKLLQMITKNNNNQCSSESNDGNVLSDHLNQPSFVISTQHPNQLSPMIDI